MMRLTKRRVGPAVLWCAALAWLALCFVLSWQTGDETVQVSSGLTALLLRVLGWVNIRPDAGAFHMALRSAAHVGLFLVLGALWDGAFFATLGQGMRALLCSLAVCLPSAALAEIGKLWVPGRHLQWDELGLNLLGALVGAAIICTVTMLATKRRRMARPT